MQTIDISEKMNQFGVPSAFPVPVFELAKRGSLDEYDENLDEFDDDDDEDFETTKTLTIMKMMRTSLTKMMI
jgi:hypothetical protein